MFTNGRLARSLLKCRTLAARSLPVPLSPVSRTVDAGLAATLRSRSRSAPIAADSPTMRSSAKGCAWLARSMRTSRRSRVVSSARSTIERDVVEVERLVGEVVGADLHRLDRGVHRGVGGQQDDDDVGVVLLDPAQHGDAVDVGQLVVEQHEIDAVGDALERLLAGRRLHHVVPVGPQALDQRPADQRLVVDDQDRGVGRSSIGAVDRAVAWSGGLVEAVRGARRMQPSASVTSTPLARSACRT